MPSDGSVDEKKANQWSMVDRFFFAGHVLAGEYREVGCDWNLMTYPSVEVLCSPVKRSLPIGLIQPK